MTLLVYIQLSFIALLVYDSVGGPTNVGDAFCAFELECLHEVT